MKKFYQELLRREGGKRNLTAADVSEVVKHIAEMVVDHNSGQACKAFEKYLAKKMSESLSSMTPYTYKTECLIGFRSERQRSKKMKRARKK